MEISTKSPRFLGQLSLAARSGRPWRPSSLADEGPPETTTIRLRRDPAICVAPWYIAEDLLRAEGFTDIRYVPAPAGAIQLQMIARGELDFVIILPRQRSSFSSMPAYRSRRLRACMPDVSSCSHTSPSGPSAT